MPSHAQKHRSRHAAIATHDIATGDEQRAEGSAYELMLAKLVTDKRRLKDIKSLQAKIELKAKLIPEYLPWIYGVLTASQPAQDEVLATVMVWMIDAGAIAEALPVASFMLHHDLKLPEHFQRDLATLLVEEIADQAGRPDVTVTTDQLLQVGQLTEGRDMPDEVRAKLHKAIGLGLLEDNPRQALDHLQQALKLNARSGVTQHIKKLEKQLDTPPAH